MNLHCTRTALPLLVAALLLPAALQAGEKTALPFFAFDNGVGQNKWAPEKQAAVLKELGYDGISADHQGGWKQLIQTLDRGTFDTAALLEKLSQAGYQGPVGLQCYAITGDPRKNLERSMAAWQALTGTAKR